MDFCIADTFIDSLAKQNALPTHPCIEFFSGLSQQHCSNATPPYYHCVLSE